MSERLKRAHDLAVAGAAIWAELYELSGRLAEVETFDARLQDTAEFLVRAGVNPKYSLTEPSPLLKWARAFDGVDQVRISELGELLLSGSDVAGGMPIAIPLLAFDSAILAIHESWGTDTFPYPPLALVK